MNVREDATNFINCLRIIEKQKKIIQDLRLNIKEEKKKHINEIRKYSFFTYNKVNRGVSERNKRQTKQKVTEVFQAINNDLNKIGLGIGGCINLIENYQNTGSNSFEVNFNHSLPINTLDDERSLYFKDKANITDKSYALFRKGLKLHDKTGSLHKLKKLRKNKGSALGIKPLDKGYYRDPVKMIKERIARFVKNLSHGEGLDVVKIKLACDGTNVSRNVKLINFVFNVINERVKAASVNGCYRIGIFRIDKEDYESTKNWLPELWKQIKELKKVVYDTIEQKILDQSEFDSLPEERSSNRFMHLDISYSFCNDMKMNLIILGLKAANSANPCMHCTVDKNNLNERGKFN